MSQKLTSDRIQVADSFEAVTGLFYQNKWSDGLPIIPPTEEAVERMLTGTRRNPGNVVTTIPPRWGEATIEKIAINAVMAGCLPEYMPVIITALEAMSEQPFNFRGLQATTFPVTFLMIVNGPIAKQLDINSKSGVFGTEFRSNATIARAIRLLLINIGGAYPGITDMATQGKRTLCIAENEEENPWEPLYVERGFAASTSTVTVACATTPHNINDHHGVTADQILHTISGTMATLGNNNIITQMGEPILALGPEHAATIAKDGLSKNDVKAIIHQRATIPRRNFHQKVIDRYFPNLDEDALISVTAKKEDLIVIVAGGPGKHSAFLPSFGETRSVTKPIL